MAFTPKDWKNLPDQSTPISRASLRDVETRVTDYADDLSMSGDGSTFARISRQAVNVKDPPFNATGDGDTDDTAAIQAAIDSLPQYPEAVLDPRGGTVFFPRGDYRFTTLNLDETTGVTLEGEGGTGGYGFHPPSSLTSTTTGSGRAVACRSTTSLTFRNLGIRYNSASFTGTLIDFGHSTAYRYGAAGDSTYALIENCLIGGDTVYSAANCISLAYAIICTIRNSVISFGQTGIRMRPTGGYSNAHNIIGCSFDNHQLGALANAGEVVTIEGCTFEGTDGGSGGLVSCYFEDATGGQPVALAFTNNWCGDVVNAAWRVFNIPPTSDFAQGVTISENLCACASDQRHTIKLGAGVTGLTMFGNQIGGQGVSLPSSSVNGLAIMGNRFISTNPVVPEIENLGTATERLVAGNSNLAVQAIDIP